MRFNFRQPLIIGIGIVFLTGCYYDNFSELHPSSGNSGACDTSGAMSFNTDIVPILNNSCGTTNSCHGTSNTSGYDLSTYGGVAATVVNTQLYSSITFDGTVSPMPKGSSNPVATCSITKIKKWIDAGYPNN